MDMTKKAEQARLLRVFFQVKTLKELMIKKGIISIEEYNTLFRNNVMSNEIIDEETKKLILNLSSD